MRKISWLVVVISVLLSLVVVTVYSTSRQKQADTLNGKHDVYSLSIPDTIDFAGEKVPLQYFDVREGLDRELHVNTYFQSQTIFYIKRANRYFPEIERILKEEGVPLDFKYLAVAESGLANVISPSKAAGFWQFLKNTGEEYKLEINDEIDERFDLEKSTRAACKYFKTAYKDFGSWTMAAVSYNMGRPGLTRQIESQKESTYYNLYLYDEPARYIYRIIAIKLIIEKPELYGFHIDKKDLYMPFQYSSITIDSSITNLTAFAKNNNTNYKMLKIFNPWLRNSALVNNTKKLFKIKIPLEGYRELINYESGLIVDSLKNIE
jgi:membrane-bound lytic murein transglycosylase D